MRTMLSVFGEWLAFAALVGWCVILPGIGLHTIIGWLK
jgi:hypothetical protein